MTTTAAANMQTGAQLSALFFHLPKQDLIAEVDLPGVIGALDFHGRKKCTAKNKDNCMGNCPPSFATEAPPTENATLPPLVSQNLSDNELTTSSDLPSATTSPSGWKPPLPPTTNTRPMPSSRQAGELPVTFTSPTNASLTVTSPPTAPPSPPPSLSASMASFPSSNLLPCLPEDTELHWLRQIALATTSFDHAEELIQKAAQLNAQGVQALQRASEMREVAEFALEDHRRRRAAQGLCSGKGSVRGAVSNAARLAEGLVTDSVAMIEEGRGRVAEDMTKSRTF